MIEPVSRTAAINEKLAADGMVTYLDEPQHIEAIIAMNENMAEVRREYQVKDRNSQISAANVILTA